jgi:biotin carboxylase
MIGKLIVWGETRNHAIEKAIKALQEFVIEGVPTTIPFLQKVLQDAEFQQGTYNLQIVDRILGKNS